MPIIDIRRVGKQVSKSEFKAKALEYFRQVEASGESLVVTNYVGPVLEVRRYREAHRNVFDVLRSSVIRYDKPTDPVGEDDWAEAR